MTSHESLLQHQEAKSEACSPRKFITSFDHCWWTSLNMVSITDDVVKGQKGNVMKNLKNEGFCCAPFVSELQVVLSV